MTTVSQSSMRSERGSSGWEGVSAAPFSVGGMTWTRGVRKLHMAGQMQSLSFLGVVCRGREEKCHIG